MGIEPPYLYQKPTKYSFVAPTEKAYNPKSVTQASWAPRPPPSKAEGPLISSKEMNRHPDSYFIVPYGNLDRKPMSARTKSKVTWTRFVQLFLRICALLGAAGLLVCVICIRPIGTVLDWIIRVPPGIAILHTVYAIYHLARSSKGRTPASSASYMIFASIVDASLLPFLAFTALMSRNQYIEADDAAGHWQTLFPKAAQTDIIIYSTYLISTTTGGIHVASLCISLYLALVFRKISKLPPDMNPLEDNLTSRHKRNKSSLSAAASDITSNRDSHLSAPLMDAPRAVPFMQSRNESESNLSATHRRPAPRSRDSRTDLPSHVYQHQTASQRSSRTDLRRSPDRPMTKRGSGLNPSQNTYPSRPTSTHHAANAYYEEDVPNSENWVSYPSPSPSPSNDKTRGVPPELRHLQQKQHFEQDQAVLRASPALSGRYDFSNRSPRPLSMNPPTPSSATFAYQPLPQSSTPEQQRRSPLQPSSGNVNNNSSPATWEERSFVQQKVKGYEGGSDVSSNASGKWLSGKSRFYGSLRSSIGRRAGRAVSSGMDDGSEGAEAIGMRGRDVSGKIAEEGRGGRVGP